MKKQLLLWVLIFSVKVNDRCFSHCEHTIVTRFSSAVILSVAVAGLVLEYARRAKNDSDKEARQLERVNNLENQLSELEVTLTNHTAQMLQLERLIQHHVSPPSKGDGPSKNGPPVSSGTPTNSKQATGQALSLVDTSTMAAPLIQLHPSMALLLPVFEAIQRMDTLVRVPMKKWLSSDASNH
jgi:hypothetical protein